MTSNKKQYTLPFKAMDLLVTISEIYVEPWVCSLDLGPSLRKLQHKRCLFIKPGEILFTLRINEDPRHGMTEIPIMLQFIHKDMVVVGYFSKNKLITNLKKFVPTTNNN